MAFIVVAGLRGYHGSGGTMINNSDAPPSLFAGRPDGPVVS